MITEPEELNKRAENLEEIKDQIMGLIDDARRQVRGTPQDSRATSYWLAHLEMAITRNGRYLGGSMITMEETIASLREDALQDEEDPPQRHRAGLR